MTKPDIVRAWCAQRVGCPYIYGATGQPCTTAYRKARMAQYPTYAAKIKKNCQRLSGNATTCADCRWADPETGIGKLSYDCAQLSRKAMEAVGIPMVSGANSQWNQTDWDAIGYIADMPRDKVCLVFRFDAGKNGMGHVGVYQGDGTVIHAKGHDYGVVRQNISDVTFTHYLIPAGLYEEGEMTVIHPILRRGDSGESVTYLQTLLGDVGEPIKADGKFGPATEKAVKDFQRIYKLSVDGVVGPKTWAALEKAAGHEENDPGVWDPDAPEIVTPPVVDMPGERLDDPGEAAAPDAPDGDVVPISHQDWAAIKAAASVLIQAVRKYEEA